jgi:glycosyltransferase involved in cell wall biosynthesis
MTVTVVVPTARQSVLTVDSLPDDVPVEIRRDEGLNRARNAGVEAAETGAVIIMDDDLAFEEDWFRSFVRRVEENPDVVFAARGTGILPEVRWPTGFEPGLGRVMGFHREAWRATGGFPVPCAHGGDTDFLISAYEHGYDVVAIDHEWDHRDDEEDVYSLADNLAWLWFLLRRNPRLVGPRLPALLATKLGGDT